LAFNTDEVMTLSQLGLTFSQAKIYLSLLRLGQATGKTVSEQSKMARQEVYRIIRELQEKGLVEKIISAPTEFKPVTIDTCVSMLVKQRQADLGKTEKKAHEMLDNFKTLKNVVKPLEPSFFILIPEKEAYLRKFKGWLDNTQKSCDMILCWECFRFGMTQDTETWEKAVVRGVNVRFIVFNYREEKNVLQVVNRLKRKGNVNIRFSPTQPPATMAIFDKEEASFSISPAPQPYETPNLWTNNPGLIEVFQDYFDNNWLSQKGKPDSLAKVLET
jgi:sugar-specific transcriptional regulator TrmB